MEYAMYPSKVIRITQKHGVGTHKRNYAVDEAGKDGGIGNAIAPFTGTIKRIYKNDANEVWLQSKNKVKYADGTEDYMTIMFAHDNSVTSLYEGKEIKQGEVFYQEGTKGQATGNHIHFECGKGKFTGTGWHNDNGSWDINNGKRVDECLFIDDTYTIKNTAGYKFKNVKDIEPKLFGTPVKRDESVNQIKILNKATDVRARKTANGTILGHMNVGIYNYSEVKNKDGYDWYKVESGLWFAYSKEWAELLPKKEVVVEEKKESADSTETIAALQNEIKTLKEQLENQPKKIFTCTEDCICQFKMFKGEQLFIK